MVTSRSATFDELDAVKKELQTLEGRVDRIVTGLNAALQHAQQADQHLRRTERLDVARLQALQGLDVTLIVALLSAWPRTLQKIEKMEHAIAKLQHDAGGH